MIKANYYIGMVELRWFCVKHKYYTQGTNEAYSYLLEQARDLFNQAENEEERMYYLEGIAEDIYNHSDKNIWKTYDASPEEIVAEIMFEMAQEQVILQAFEVIKG